ncbi:bifunctional demethylmenaquinone methyltransferase/2-methoxy-6-polyprenyl-1,4-benzoquinol methylase UbiE [Salinisphaera sp. USBA-960]|nr:bifunctional demethylmenaquinone methyltransferase/2-methoxy-6-polyprenyl-1,4-benzoquinol methylase UbiE [Salifodinibacter halophilus]NNC26998.1 bifunctional demethylmenaquinone methyltransferase/2-methoxy-6-polyprenyl-1,4-benzoquinol methylase UbiE [Salifodinibacter halophilus]
MPETRDTTTTDFGYEEIDWSEKKKRVGAVFDSVAGRYDLMNDLMSGGIHRLWKRFTVELAAVQAGDQVLDVAGGTGDLAAAFARRAGRSGRVTLSDVNESMLGAGRDQLADRGVVGNVDFTIADAEALPFEDASFDCVTIGFGLRNVTDKQQALNEMTRVVKPGGRVLVLEFSQPQFEALDKLYERYSFSVLPRLGRFVTGDEDAYRYLVESIRMHPDQETLAGMMRAAGLERVDWYDQTGGIVAVHRGYRP